jgi:hypothetical protein
MAELHASWCTTRDCITLNSYRIIFNQLLLQTPWSINHWFCVTPPYFLWFCYITPVKHAMTGVMHTLTAFTESQQLITGDKWLIITKLSQGEIRDKGFPRTIYSSCIYLGTRPSVQLSWYSSLRSERQNGGLVGAKVTTCINPSRCHSWSTYCRCIKFPRCINPAIFFPTRIRRDG